jgi:hypothetical protein
MAKAEKKEAKEAKPKKVRRGGAPRRSDLARRCEGTRVSGGRPWRPFRRPPGAPHALATLFNPARLCCEAPGVLRCEGAPPARPVSAARREALRATARVPLLPPSSTTLQVTEKKAAKPKPEKKEKPAKKEKVRRALWHCAALGAGKAPCRRACMRLAAAARSLPACLRAALTW